MIANKGGLRTVAQSTGKEFTTVGLLFNLKSASLKSPTMAGTLLPIYSV